MIPENNFLYELNLKTNVEQSTFVTDEVNIKNDTMKGMIISETKNSISIIISGDQLIGQNTILTDHFELLFSQIVIFISNKYSNDINTYIVNTKEYSKY